MGELFSKMANLVMEQSEKIANIEDDVESGLDNTLQAEQHVHTAYEITKGNRSVIIKIFAILLVCIVIFLYWT
jgi:t-SNARE complex subunit (syntaxin)